MKKWEYLTIETYFSRGKTSEIYANGKEVKKEVATFEFFNYINELGIDGWKLEVISKMVNWRSNPTWERANGSHRRTMDSC